MDVSPSGAEIVSATLSNVDLTFGIPHLSDADHSTTAGTNSDKVTDRVGESVTVVPLHEYEDGADKPNDETSPNIEPSHSVPSSDDRPSDSIPAEGRYAIALDHNYDVSSSKPL